MQHKIIASLLGASTLLLTNALQAGEASWSDPLPNTSSVAAVAATATAPAVAAKPATGGIGYEWTVTLGNNDSAGITGSVGAKSAYEPANVAKGPEWAWTHTSDMIALDLTADADVSIMVMAVQGVTDASIKKDSNPAVIEYKPAGKLLNPVVSVFKNWEESGVETSTFNPVGKTTWANELVYVGVAADLTNQKMTKYTAKLTKGKYTLMIGGANAVTGNGCAETNTACYTGNHGYYAYISTGSMK